MDDKVIGMTEVSIQRRDPLCTSCAFVIPTLKRFIFSGKGLVPYISAIMEGQSDNFWIGNAKINGIHMVEGVPLSML